MEEEQEVLDWRSHKPYIVARRELFGRRLRKEMLYARVSIGVLSLGTGIEEEKLEKYRSGEEFPSVENLLSICNFLQITASDLLGV